MKIPSSGTYQLQGKNVQAPEVAAIMAELIRELAQNDPFTIETSYAYNFFPYTGMFLNSLADYIYKNAYFEPDPPTYQVLRTPNAIMRERAANCVDYTIFLGAVCFAAGLPVTIRIVKFEPNKNFVHVFPIINGVPIDLVIGQNQQGREKEERQNNNFVHFGKEVDYFAKFDTPV